MKKILLASTILAGTAGFAAADSANFTFSGEAYTGLAFSMGWDEVEATAGRDFNGDGDLLDIADLDGDAIFGENDVTIFTPEVTASFTAGMMTTTDGGLEAGADVEIVAVGITMEDDHTEANFGLVEYKGGIESASVYLSGEWGKFEAAYDGDRAYVAPLIGWGGDVDFTYTNTFGDVDIEVWYEYRFGINNDEFGAELTYNFADYAVWVGAEYQQDIGVDGGYDIWAGASASMNGFSAEAEVNYDNILDDTNWYVEVGYGMDAWSVGAFVEEDNGFTEDLDFGVNASYDLGGGVSVDAAYIYDQDKNLGDGVSLAKVGVSMAF